MTRCWCDGCGGELVWNGGERLMPVGELLLRVPGGNGSYCPDCDDAHTADLRALQLNLGKIGVENIASAPAPPAAYTDEIVQSIAAAELGYSYDTPTDEISPLIDAREDPPEHAMYPEFEEGGV